MELNKNQHFVPQQYLKRWKDPNLYTLFKNKNTIEKRNTTSIASKKYFYENYYISENEFEFVRLSLDVDNQPHHIKDYDENIIQIYKEISNSIKLLENSKDQDIERNKKILKTSSDDLYNKIIEDDLEKYLKLIDNHDYKFLYVEPDRYEFDNIITHQYLRTYNIRNNFLKSYKEELSKVEIINQFFKNINLNSCWNIMSKIIANRICVDFVRKNYNYYILYNNTNQEFITSDQPVINLDWKEGKNTESMSFYFPVSKQKAILFTSQELNKYVDNNCLSVNEVKFFNNQIVNKSYNEVYSSDEILLNEFLL